MSGRVFISYASPNQALAQEVLDFLEPRGFPCWIAPRDVRAGRDYGEEIITAIEECSVMVLILSNDANASAFVKNEVERAFSKKKTIVPFRTQNVPPSRALELFVASSHWIEAWNPPREHQLNCLARAVAEFLPLGAVNAPPATPTTPPLHRQLPTQVVPPTATAAVKLERPANMSPYFRVARGRIEHEDGSVQTFVGFRCFYSGRMYFSKSLTGLTPDTYRSASGIDVPQIERIDFTERPNAYVRRGSLRFVNGKVLEQCYFYVDECEWWDEPGLQGKLSERTISAIVFDTQEPQAKSAQLGYEAERE